YRLQRTWSEVSVAARRAAGCAAFASVSVGAWLAGVWLLGNRFVYDAEADDPARASLVSGSRGGIYEHAPVQPVAGGDGEPESERVGTRRSRDPRAYPRDGRSRGMLSSACPEVALATFAGESIPFLPPARVAVPFRARLVELER